jgi:hypothetical protein
MERFSARAWPLGYFNHALFALGRQLLLADLVGDLDWAYDLPTGLLSCGDRYRWPAEVLGTESEETGTWLWAWANAAGNVPPEPQAAARLSWLHTTSKPEIGRREPALHDFGLGHSPTPTLHCSAFTTGSTSDIRRLRGISRFVASTTACSSR